ncbi:MAG: hypothetical protein ACJARX_001383 [Psychroserpens sp.]|jgi:hypothetical protein|uniref:hypothetical protein n=1 Tax=Psychroserpens sp. TaxID=2020870 RepID=UPI0039E421B8
MEAHLEYNSNKAIDELLYNTSQFKQKLMKLDEELRFCKFLIEARIFKPRVMNLFETLMIFDKKIDLHTIRIENLLLELKSHSNKITNKIECNDLECDMFFIKTQDKLERKSHNFITDVENLKSQIFQYLKSTIKNV